MKITIELDDDKITKDVEKIAKDHLSTYFCDKYGRPTHEGRALAEMIGAEVSKQNDRIRQIVASAVNEGLEAAVRNETGRALKRIAKAKVKAAEQLGMLVPEDGTR